MMFDAEERAPGDLAHRGLCASASATALRSLADFRLCKLVIPSHDARLVPS
jgi:hypothetical protein